jgi:hypothetical protein
MDPARWTRRGPPLLPGSPAARRCGTGRTEWWRALAKISGPGLGGACQTLRSLQFPDPPSARSLARPERHGRIEAS